MTTAGVTTYCNFHRMKKCLRINDAGKLERSSSICRRLDLVLTVLGGKDQSHNQPIQTKDLSEDKNEDHAHKQSWLLGCSAYSRITNYTNGKTGSQARQSDAQTGPKMNKAPVDKNKQDKN